MKIVISAGSKKVSDEVTDHIEGILSPFSFSVSTKAFVISGNLGRTTNENCPGLTCKVSGYLQSWSGSCR